CGAGHPSRHAAASASRTVEAGPAARAVATQIERRLRRAGYPIDAVRLLPQGTAFQLLVTPAESRAAVPGEQLAFFVQADFACTCSFHFTVSVFDSHADALTDERNQASQNREIAVRLCSRRPACRRSPARWLPAHAGLARDAVSGVVEYQG